MTLSKLKKKTIYPIKRGSQQTQNYVFTFCVLKYYNFIYLKPIQPGSYPTDRGSVRWTNSIRDNIEHKGLSNTLVTW